MEIRIGSQDISDIVTSAQLVESCLAESEAITLSGRRQIDRFGIFKARLIFVVGNIRYAHWQALTEQLKALPISVTVKHDGGNTKSYQMCMDGEIPSPHVYTDTDGDYCANISVALKEVG